MIFCSLVSQKFLYQAREWSVMYLYVRGISILSLSTSLILDFRNIRTVFFFVLFHDCSFHCFIVQKYLCSWISIKFILLQCWTIQYRVMSIWSKSHLSLAPQCRCVGDLKKTHYGSYASDPMSWISNDIINTGCDRHLFRLIGLLTANKSVQC
jgi:hypothetical protein